MAQDEITILTTSQLEEKAGLPNFKSFSKKEIKVNPADLANNLKDFLATLKPVIEAQTTKIGEFSVEEIELSLAINAKGGIELIGKFDAGIEGGIKIKLKRKDSPDKQ